jgi:serine/threonine protein phosphatase PrpC
MKNAELWTSIADELCADAIRRGCGDNVSVLIIVLQNDEEIRKLLSI